MPPHLEIHRWKLRLLTGSEKKNEKGEERERSTVGENS
jgi:hypothetical protein